MLVSRTNSGRKPSSDIYVLKTNGYHDVLPIAVPNSSVAHPQLELHQETHHHVEKKQSTNRSPDEALIANRLRASRYFRLALLMMPLRLL
eukprot:9323900-Pyramimonas_sp.AAC.1